MLLCTQGISAFLVDMKAPGISLGAVMAVATL